MAGKFEISKRKNGEFQFNLKAANGQVILTSEGYKARDSALNGIESVRTNSQDDGRFERLTAKDGSPYFVLKAGNGQVIGHSSRAGRCQHAGAAQFNNCGPRAANG